MLQFWSFQTRWNASSFPRVGWNHGMLEREQLAGLKKVGIFVWFSSCVGSEWIPEASGSSLHILGLEALYVYLPLGAKSHRSIDVDNTPLYTYTFGISIPGNSPGYFSHSVFLKNRPLFISACWSDFTTTCHANSSHSMMVDSWNRHWPLRRIGFSFLKGKVLNQQKPRDFRLWARESVWQCLALDVENESKTHIFQNQRIKKRENSDAEAIVSSGAFGKPQLW